MTAHSTSSLMVRNRSPHERRSRMVLEPRRASAFPLGDPLSSTPTGRPPCYSPGGKSLSRVTSLPRVTDWRSGDSDGCGRSQIMTRRMSLVAGLFHSRAADLVLSLGQQLVSPLCKPRATRAAKCTRTRASNVRTPHRRSEKLSEMTSVSVTSSELTRHVEACAALSTPFKTLGFVLLH